MDSMIDVTDDQALAAICAEAAQQPYVVLDTEFIRERTYYPILALVQMAWRDQDPVLIDPLQIKDWAPFHALLKNPEVRKIFHAGRQDVEIFYYQMNAMPENIFDTQIAASMCGYGDQIGYSALVARLLGKNLEKGSSFTNWLQRPLTNSQLKYARDDVLYLSDVYERLWQRAEAKKRTNWIEEEIKAQLNGSIFEPEPSMMWRKVKKSNSLAPRNQVVLRSLAQWRFETARELDKPLRYILSDEAMIELCKLGKLTREGLSSRRGMQSKILDRYGDQIMKLHAEARQMPKGDWPQNEKRGKPPSEKSEGLADLVWLLLKEIAREMDMAPTHLINKKDLAPYIENLLRGKDVSHYPIGRGWRSQMVGEPLRDLIDGKITIGVRNHQIVWDHLDRHNDEEQSS